MITVGGAAQIYGSQLDDVGSDIGGLAVKVASAGVLDKQYQKAEAAIKKVLEG